MISLRTIEGIELQNLSDAEEKALMKAAQKYILQNLLIHEGDVLRLSNEGKLYADGIAADLFFDEQ
nr:hypothetical protein [Niabella ginsengisoli]